MNSYKYDVNNFLCFEIEDYLILQNESGVVRVEDKRLIDFLKNLDVENSIHLCEQEVSTVFPEEYSEVIKFLERYNVISPVKKLNFNIQGISFYANNVNVISKMEDILNGISEVKSNMIDNIDDYVPSDDELLVVFLNPYSKKHAKRIRDMVINFDHHYLLFTYVYNNALYIDPIYSSSFKNPCHLCHIENIEAQLRINTTGNITYQHMIDSLYSEINNFKVERPLTNLDVLNIVSQIGNRLERLVTLKKSNIVFMEEYQHFFCMDLDNKNFFKDNSLHWELCDCYE
ncbi:McbB family protein [Shouchella miscanthi]|uniref:McbB family protein n=1 Tax=Shouchella miscanthi TaxID=2598861 RepID=A0ABU6NML7_9BACI|nr:McbB family protein [Shouchella miscanthi]